MLLTFAFSVERTPKEREKKTIKRRGKTSFAWSVLRGTRRRRRASHNERFFLASSSSGRQRKEERRKKLLCVFHIVDRNIRFFVRVFFSLPFVKQQKLPLKFLQRMALLSLPCFFFFFFLQISECLNTRRSCEWVTLPILKANINTDLHFQSVSVRLRLPSPLWKFQGRISSSSSFCRRRMLKKEKKEGENEAKFSDERER